MIKNILLGVLFTAIAGVLIFGGVNRTLAKQDNEVRTYEEGGGGYGRNAAEEGARRPAEGWLAAPGGAYSGGQGGGYGYGRQEAAASGAPQPQAEVNEWITLEGQAASADTTCLIVTISAGEQIEISGRAWSYAQEQGFSANAGDALQLTGFYDSGELFETGAIANQTSGQTVALRDENGRPRWAGRGRRG